MSPSTSQHETLAEDWTIYSLKLVQYAIYCPKDSNLQEITAAVGAVVLYATTQIGDGRKRDIALNK